MGYQNEGASPNKYKGMKEYCDKHIIKSLSKLRQSAKKAEDDIKALKATFEYTANKNKNVPMAAIDGGMATIFPNEIEETKILKVAAGWGPEFDTLFSDRINAYIHIHTGVLKWPVGVEKTLNEVIDELMTVILEHPLVEKAIKILDLDVVQLDEAIRSRINHLKPKHKDQVTGFEDNLREILELSAMVVFTYEHNQSEVLVEHFQKHSLLLPYVLVKDGTLYPSKMTASTYFATAVAQWFNRGDIAVVGVIKNSRFVNKENVWSKLIIDYAKKVKHNTFFRIPAAIELSIDKESDTLDFKRYFLSLYGGEGLFEIQVPKVLSADELKLKQIFDGLAAQVSLMYNGSIVTNSYAHQGASLPESEARFLTDTLRRELKNLSKEKKESEDEE